MWKTLPRHCSCRRTSSLVRTSKMSACCASGRSATARRSAASRSATMMLWPCGQQLLRLVGRLAVGRKQCLQQVVVLTDQPAGAIVLLERDARALDAFVLHLLVDEGKRRRLLIVLGEIDDRRRQRGRRLGSAGCAAFGSASRVSPDAATSDPARTAGAHKAAQGRQRGYRHEAPSSYVITYHSL